MKKEYEGHGRIRIRHGEIFIELGVFGGRQSLLALLLLCGGIEPLIKVRQIRTRVGRNGKRLNYSVGP